MSKDYDVGYGKPPEHSRFRPGQSGNPKGRPRKPQTISGILEQELAQSINVIEAGRTRRMTIRQALGKRLIKDALEGNLRAWKVVYDISQSQTTPDAFAVDSDDLEALAHYLNSKSESEGDQDGSGNSCDTPSVPNESE